MGGRSKKGAKAYLASIGLKAPYTCKTEDYDASQPVKIRQLYETDIVEICRRHAHESPSDIRQSWQVKKEARILFEQYAPRIWCRRAHRPWLFKPGRQKYGRYRRDLYYDVPQDRNFLRRQFVALVVSKASRYASDHGPGGSKVKCTILPSPAAPPSEQNDPDYSPSPEKTDDDTVSYTGESVNDEVCEHLDTRMLQRQGVWLGDRNDSDREVNGTPWRALQDLFRIRVERGRTEGAPYQLQEPEPKTVRLQCPLCPNDPSVKIVSLGILAREDESDEAIAHVWALPLLKRTRNCFAIMKRSPLTSANTDIWSFWMINGSFTCQSILVSLPNRSKLPNGTSIAGPSRIPNRPSGSEFLCGTGSNGGFRSRRFSEDLHDDGDEGDDGARTSATDVADFVVRTAHLQGVSGQSAPSKAFGKRPLTTNAINHEPIVPRARSQNGSINYGNDDFTLFPETPSLINAPRESSWGFFKPFTSIADEQVQTVESQEAGNGIGEEIRVSQGRHRITGSGHRDDSETIHGDSCAKTKRTASVPSFNDNSLTIDAQNSAEPRNLAFLFTEGSSGPHRMVTLHTSLSFASAYARIQRKLNQKQTEEGDIDFDLTFKLPSPPSSEKGLELVVDDEDSWLTVVKHVNKHGLEKIYGVVSQEVA